MAEPSLLVASIPMDPTAYQRFVKAVADEFAAAAADIVINSSEDWLIFRYLKKEQSFFLAFVFRWSDAAEDIMKRPYFVALAKACEFLSAGHEGRMIISAGALNFMQDEIDAAFTLKGSGQQRQDAVDETEQKRFDGLLNKYLFAIEPGSTPYQDAMRKPSILEPKIRKKVDVLLEVRRQRIAIERVPHATPPQPVRLFENYHYNGHFMLYRKPGGMRPLAGLDPYTTLQRPWGASDTSHVAVGHRLIATDPSKFRVIPIPGGEGDALYRDERHVYDIQCRVIPGADPKSFKYIAGCYARDKDRWYHIDGTVLDDVGPHGRVDNTLYYNRNCLLISPTAVYMGARRLPVDAASFAIKRVERVRLPRSRELRMLWCTDNQGDLVVSDGSFGWDQDEAPTMTRTSSPQAVWDAAIASDDSAFLPPLVRAVRTFEVQCPEVPPDEAGQQRIANFGAAWFAEHTDAFVQSEPYNDGFWRAVQNYFHACWQLKHPQAIIELYERVKTDAWWNPYVFHHTACAYVAAGALEQAVQEVRLALACGYERIDDLLVDPDLAPIMEHADFKAVKEFRDQHKDVRRPFLPGAVLRSLVAKNGAFGQLGMDGKLERRFYIPRNADIEAGFDAPTAATYRCLLSATIDGIVRTSVRPEHYPCLDDDFYISIRNVPGLSASCHLAGALELFAEGWFWVDMKANDTEPRPEFAHAIDALKRMRQALAADLNAANDPLWLLVSGHPVSGPFIALANTLSD